MTAPGIRHRALLLGAALLFSTGGAAIKSADLTGWQIACFRSGIAALVLVAAVPEARRRWRFGMVPVAAFYSATLITFVLANRLTTSASAIFLQSTAPVYLLLLGPLLLKERIHRSDVFYVAAVVSALGAFFFAAEPPAATAPDPRKGNGLALFSGLLFALMLAGLRWLSRSKEGNAGTATVALGNALACAAALPVAAPLPGLTGQNLAVVLYLGIFQIGLAYVFLTRAMRHVPALEAATILMIEPALNPVWAWLIHGEQPGGWTLTGGAVILCATLANTWRQSRMAAG